MNLNLASLLLTAAIIGICFRVRRDVVGGAGWTFVLIGGIAWKVQSLIVIWLATFLAFPRLDMIEDDHCHQS